MKKVEIDVESGKASTLYFTYAPVTSAVESERINSREYICTAIYRGKRKLKNLTVNR